MAGMVVAGGGLGDAKAALMTAARGWGADRRRRQEDRRLRRLREACRRSGDEWRRAASVRRLQQLDACPMRAGKRRRLQGWAQQRKSSRDILGTQWDRLRTFSRGDVCPAVLRPFAEDVLAHPAGHATMAFMWAPEVRPEIEGRLPKAMQSEQIRRQVDWERRHDQVTNDQAMPVPAETPAAKRFRHCREIDRVP